jgi:hypothetical protein
VRTANRNQAFNWDDSECKSLAGKGYDGGQLKCAPSCSLDESACQRCGDSKRTGLESTTFWS